MHHKWGKWSRFDRPIGSERGPPRSQQQQSHAPRRQFSCHRAVFHHRRPTSRYVHRQTSLRTYLPAFVLTMSPFQEVRTLSSRWGAGLSFLAVARVAQAAASAASASSPEQVS